MTGDVLHGTVDALDMIEIVVSEMVNTVDTIEMVLEIWKFGWGLYSGPLNSLNPELNPICYLLALLGAHHFLHVSRIRVKLLTFRRLMSYIYIYIYGAPIFDVSRSHTMTQHSR